MSLRLIIITYRTSSNVSDAVVGWVVDIDEITCRRKTESRISDLQSSSPGSPYLYGSFVLFFQMFTCNTPLLLHV